MLTIMEQDELARKRITTEINSNFFVEAAAGSGKTSSLVDRMTAMIGAGIDVSRICAITFTRAAAKEFYNRFQKQLMERSREEEDEVRRTRFSEALRNIDLCFMGTIDSFSDMLLHEHPVEAGIPSETTVCADKEATPAYLAEYVRIKRGEYSPELQRKYELFRSVQMKPDAVFENCIGIFAGLREADFVYSPPEDTDVNTRYTNWKYRLVRTLQYLHEHPEYVGTVKPSQAILERLPYFISVLRKPWNEQIGNVLKVFKEMNELRLGADSQKQPVTPESIGLELTDVFEPHENAKGKLDYYILNLIETDVYKDLKKLQYAATIDFFVSASREIAAEMQSSGILTFHNALLTLRDMLRRDAENGGRLIRHIAERHSYYLVDEFQDTNPLQSEVVFYLAAQDPQPDWKACIPRPGALFIVGDPKQSIYRFTGADIGAFLRVRSLFEKQAGEVLTLSKNFRSTAKLRRFFNTVFPDMLHEILDVQSAYHQIPISNDKEYIGFSGVYTYRSTVSSRGAMLDDPQLVCEVVKRLIGNPAVRLKNGKLPKYSDIKIIANQKKQTASIAKELTANGIPVRVEGKIEFLECAGLSEAVRLYAAAANPQDAMAVFNALTAKTFRICEDEITRFCGIGGRLNAFADQDEVLTAFPLIQKALEKIKEYANAGTVQSCSGLFEMITDHEQVFAGTGSDTLEAYCFAVELLRQAENAGEIMDHKSAAEFLNKLLTDPDKERCVSLSPDDNRVHIANLHKVKGLQAPIVILADPTATKHEPILRVVRSLDRTECRIFKLKNGNSTIAETDAFSSDSESEEKCLAAEKERLLYVAATRAESILIIGDSVTETGEPFDKNPWKVFLESAEGPVTQFIPENPTAITVPEPRADGTEMYEKAAAQSVLADTSVNAPTYQIRIPSRMKLKPVTAEEPEDQPEREPLDRNAALTGTLVHRLMECIVSGGIPADTNMLISSILHEYEAEEQVYRPLLKKVLDTITHGGYPQENGVPTDLLTVLRDADEVYCEVPFCQQRGSEIVKGIIDLLYCSGSEWHIVDYKTNAERSRLAEKYAAQLAAYTEAVREIIGVEADAGIYHIDV